MITTLNYCFEHCFCHVVSSVKKVQFKLHRWHMILTVHDQHILVSVMTDNNISDFNRLSCLTGPTNVLKHYNAPLSRTLKPSVQVC